MIIKRICCTVKEGFKEEFHHHQRQWHQLKNIQGFIGQTGGWNLSNSHSALIYSFWRSKNDYQSFMRNEHDQIFVNSGQENTYYSIKVSVFEQNRMNVEVKNHLRDLLIHSHSIKVDYKPCMKNTENLPPFDLKLIGNAVKSITGQCPRVLVLEGLENKDYEHYFSKVRFERFKVEEDWIV
jgi:heme-degrading monooxygenase HmoA